MRSIGIRELKRSLSATLRSVADGERVRVTSRGRPVADLVPAGAPAADDRLRALIAQGRIAPPARAKPQRPPRPRTCDRSASKLVLAERDAEP